MRLSKQKTSNLWQFCTNNWWNAPSRKLSRSHRNPMWSKRSFLCRKWRMYKNTKLLYTMLMVIYASARLVLYKTLRNIVTLLMASHAVWKVCQGTWVVIREQDWNVVLSSVNVMLCYVSNLFKCQKLSVQKIDWTHERDTL